MVQVTLLRRTLALLHDPNVLAAISKGWSARKVASTKLSSSLLECQADLHEGQKQSLLLTQTAGCTVYTFHS